MITILKADAKSFLWSQRKTSREGLRNQEEEYTEGMNLNLNNKACSMNNSDILSLVHRPSTVAFMIMTYLSQLHQLATVGIGHYNH
jgi:hypothetical protein